MSSSGEAQKNKSLPTHRSPIWSHKTAVFACSIKLSIDSHGGRKFTGSIQKRSYSQAAFICGNYNLMRTVECRFIVFSIIFFVRVKVEFDLPRVLEARDFVIAVAKMDVMNYPALLARECAGTDSFRFLVHLP